LAEVGKAVVASAEKHSQVQQARNEFFINELEKYNPNMLMHYFFTSLKREKAISKNETATADLFKLRDEDGVTKKSVGEGELSGWATLFARKIEHAFRAQAPDESNGVPPFVVLINLPDVDVFGATTSKSSFIMLNANNPLIKIIAKAMEEKREINPLYFTVLEAVLVHEYAHMKRPHLAGEAEDQRDHHDEGFYDTFKRVGIALQKAGMDTAILADWFLVNVAYSFLIGEKLEVEMRFKTEEIMAAARHFGELELHDISGP
jgi:hypothetical protein